jgi:spermidine synthase
MSWTPSAEPGHPLDVLHLGGGALTLPRYVAATRPGSRQDVVEADRGLLDLVGEHLPVPDGCGIAVHGDDARRWLEAAAPDSADVLVADVFGGSRVPAHLTSVAYARAAERVLRTGGDLRSRTSPTERTVLRIFWIVASGISSLTPFAP